VTSVIIGSDHYWGGFWGRSCAPFEPGVRLAGWCRSLVVDRLILRHVRQGRGDLGLSDIFFSFSSFRGLVVLGMHFLSAHIVWLRDGKFGKRTVRGPCGNSCFLGLHIRGLGWFLLAEYHTCIGRQVGGWAFHAILSGGCMVGEIKREPSRCWRY